MVIIRTDSIPIGSAFQRRVLSDGDGVETHQDPPLALELAGVLVSCVEESDALRVPLTVLTC